MAHIGLTKNDPGLLIAHANDEGFLFPLIHCKLEFRDLDDKFVPVLTFCPIISEELDEDSQRRLSDKLKTMVIDSVTTNLRFQWEIEGELLGLFVKDGKRHLVPLPKSLITNKLDATKQPPPQG